MSIAYTSKLAKRQYHVTRDDLADMVERKASMCVNCCEESENWDGFCEVCECFSIFPVLELVNRQWFIIG